jgi:hypothetical protein
MIMTKQITTPTSDLDQDETHTARWRGGWQCEFDTSTTERSQVTANVC